MTDLMWQILTAAAADIKGAALSGRGNKQAGRALQYRGFGFLNKSESRFIILPAGHYVIRDAQR